MDACTLKLALQRLSTKGLLSTLYDFIDTITIAIVDTMDCIAARISMFSEENQMQLLTGKWFGFCFVRTCKIFFPWGLFFMHHCIMWNRFILIISLKLISFLTSQLGAFSKFCNVFCSSACFC